MTFSLFRTQELAERRLPRNALLRRAGQEDEPATFDVMRRAMGYEMNWQHHLATRRHLRAAPASSYWLAEEMPRFGRPRVVGYAHSMTRDRVWSLTEFFVLPTHHRQGIGRALLHACLEDGNRQGAENRLVLASQNPSADALYIRRAGCVPRVPMFLLSGPAANLRPPPDAPDIQDYTMNQYDGSAFDAPLRTGGGQDGLTAEPMILTAETLAWMEQQDRDIVGYARSPEHALWTALMGGREGASRLFRQAETGRIVGYAYFGPTCSGPALAVAPELLPAMIAHVVRVAAHQARVAQGGLNLLEPPDPYWAMAGTNEVLLRWLLECGWQIVFQYLFMSVLPLGRLDRYACHNPLYML